MGKFYEAIMGLVVGDALGVPFEFRQRDTFTATDMTGYGTYNQPPGTWSDDSSMTLATIESLERCGKVNPHDLMYGFYGWLHWNKFTPHGKVFDVGGTTRTAINRFQAGWNAEFCGGCSDRDNGNGALMRILPMAFYPGTIRDVVKVASLTHNHAISNTACALYVCIAVNLWCSEKHQAIQDGFEMIERIIDVPRELNRLKAMESLTRDEIKSTGFVVDTLEAALWCLLNTDNYKECVLMAVNLGGDTDTIAAVAGGLAGILYGIGGEKGIPNEWIKQIVKNEEIRSLCESFEDRFGNV